VECPRTELLAINPLNPVVRPVCPLEVLGSNHFRCSSAAGMPTTSETQASKHDAQAVVGGDTARARISETGEAWRPHLPVFLFSMLDADGDGRITRQEYNAAFNILDKNGDGVISREEFNCASGAPFAMLDKDGDGYISVKEWADGWQYFDTDKDGCINAKEFNAVVHPEELKLGAAGQYFKAVGNIIGRAQGSISAIETKMIESSEKVFEYGPSESGPTPESCGEVAMGTMLNGTHTQVYDTVGTYTGHFVNGRRHGYGVFNMNNFGRYSGEFRNNSMQGRGVLALPIGRAYVGEWHDCRQHGSGIYTWPDGRRHEGEYFNGLKHGWGLFKFANGARSRV
jgi:hypothetical protein